jgi:hypothetical protein
MLKLEESSLNEVKHVKQLKLKLAESTFLNYFMPQPAVFPVPATFYEPVKYFCF